MKNDVEAQVARIPYSRMSRRLYVVKVMERARVTCY